MIELNNDKYIKLMWDYCSTGIWNRDGANASYEEFEISKRLADEIKRWNRACESYADFCIENHVEIIEVKTLAQWGLLVAQKIKKEKPDLIVMFFDESKCDYLKEQPRHEYEYEILV